MLVNYEIMSMVRRKTAVVYKRKITLMQFCVTHVEGQSSRFLLN